MKFFLYILLIAISIIIASNSNSNILVNLTIGIAGGAILLLIDKIISNYKWLKYLWWSAIYFNTTIRLSISYLYRIKIGDSYFLIRGERIPNQYQPVGGVYKRYHSSKEFFSSINVLDDNLFPIDKSSKDDLRLRIKGRHLLAFIKWFESNKNRELCPWREFYEELIEVNLLDQTKFPYLFTNKIRQHVSGISWSDYAQSKELLIADIYEPILNEEQIAEFEALKNNSSDKYIFVEEEQINRLGAIPKTNSSIHISETGKWLI